MGDRDIAQHKSESDSCATAVLPGAREDGYD